MEAAELAKLKPKLRVLGRSELLVGGEAVRFRSAKVIELLAFLATHSDKSALRSQVAEALYPESTRARENLRQTLLYLSASAPGLVNAEQNRLTLGDIEVDLEDLQNGNTDAYLGPFLPQCETDWALSVRTDLEQLFVQQLVAAAETAMIDDPLRAAALAKRAIQVDPYLERPRRLRWSALERQGERAAAATERAEYADFIRAEVGIVLASPVEDAAPSSLNFAERLLRAVAHIPEAFEHGRLLAVVENLKEGIRDLPADHPYVILALINLARLQFEIGETAGAAESARMCRQSELTPDQGFELGVIEGRISARLGNIEEATRMAIVATSSKLAEVRIEAHLLLNYTHWAKGEFDLAIDQSDAAIELAKRIGSVTARVRALRSKSTNLFRAGRATKAQTCLEEGIAAAQAIGRADLEAALGSDLGRLRESAGDLELAHRDYRKAVRSLEQGDYRVQYAQALTYLGDLEYRLGNFEESRRLHALGVGTRRMWSDAVGLGTSYRGLGKAQVALGQHERAIESLRTALRYFKRLQDPGSLGSARIPLSRALNAIGESEMASRHARQAAVELADLSENSILIRYNDTSLLPEAIARFIESIGAH